MSEFKELKLSELVASSTNPRTEFEETSLNELAESIKAHGVLQPIIARVHPEDSKKFEVVCGERRFRASKLAKQKTIPASIRVLNDDEVFEIQIIENLERKDVHPMDEAVAFRRMLDSGKYSMEDIAAKVAKNLTFVAQRLKLNDLIPELKEDFLKGEFGVGHAVLFARINPERQKDFFETLGTWQNPGYGSVSKLKEYLEERSEDLDDAIFPLDDPMLNLEAGACLNCPKRTANNPVLFPEIEDNLCMDSVCFSKKDHNYRIRKIKEMLDENPNMICVTGYSAVSKDLIDTVESYGVKPLTYNDYDQYMSAKTEAFHLEKFEFVKINITSRKGRNQTGESAESNLVEEISNIKARAERALELDREKIYKRVYDEIYEDSEKKEILLNGEPLNRNEAIATALAICGYQDRDFLEQKFNIDSVPHGYELYLFFKENLTTEILNRLIRRFVLNQVVSVGRMDYKKDSYPAAAFDIFSHYFPSEIELFTLEQTAIAEKRIKKSDSRIQVLQNEINGKTDSVKRCASCKKSDEDKLEETGYPAMWKGEYCHSCSIKVQEA